MPLNATYSVKDRGELEQLVSLMTGFEKHVRFNSNASAVNVRFVPGTNIVSIRPLHADIVEIHLEQQDKSADGSVKSYIYEARPDYAKCIINDRVYNIQFRSLDI